jgi:hypothetical protein
MVVAGVDLQESHQYWIRERKNWMGKLEMQRIDGVSPLKSFVVCQQMSWARDK